MKTKLQELHSASYHLYQYIKLHENISYFYPGSIMQLVDVMNTLDELAKEEEKVVREAEEVE